MGVAMSRNGKPLGSVTIDVDGIGCYRAIHGLPQKPQGTDPIYERALPRFLDICRAENIQSTLFVVAKDLEQPLQADCIRRASEEGHEIASHSYRHAYDLSLQSPASIEADLRRANELITEVTGKKPVGFRAPGYNLSEDLVDVLDALEFRYDSSLFPAPLYFSARALAIALYQLRGRPSQSLTGDIREFLALQTPFKPSQRQRFRPARKGETARGFWEIPMSVATPFRLPWIGTTIALSPDWLGRALTRFVMRSKQPAILELHAIDFASHHDGYEPALIDAQPDLKVPIAPKLRRLARTIGTISKRRDVLTLEEIAARHEHSQGA